MTRRGSAKRVRQEQQRSCGSGKGNAGGGRDSAGRRGRGSKTGAAVEGERGVPGPEVHPETGRPKSLERGGGSEWGDRWAAYISRVRVT